MVRINMAFVLLCACILNSIITNPSYIFHDLCEQLAQIDHAEYIDKITIETTIPDGLYVIAYAYEVPSIPLRDAIFCEITDRIDECVHYDTIIRGKLKNYFPGYIYFHLKTPNDEHWANYIVGERSIKYTELLTTSSYKWTIIHQIKNGRNWDYEYSELITPYNHPYHTLHTLTP